MKLNVCLFDRSQTVKKCNKIQDKVGNNIIKGFDIKPKYNEKYLKTKVKSYEGKINADFHCHHDDFKTHKK